MAKSVRITIRRTYNWIDKDPVVDKCMALANKMGVRGQYHKMALLTGMSPSTFANWDKGATKRPQHASVACFVEALGHEYTIQEKNAHFDLERELESGRRWWKKNKPPKTAKKKPAKKARNVTKLAA
jgi:hypothetical protein